MTQLSRYFSLAEMTTTSTGLSNKPDAQQLARLTATAQAMDEVRKLLGHPIRVNSGFRSAAVNRAVGGSPTSAHALGYAVDFVCPKFGDPMAICRAIVASGIKFDQLILEAPNSATGGWVHLSFDPRMRRSILTMKNGRYTAGLSR